MPNNYGPDIEERLLPRISFEHRLTDRIFQKLRVAVPAIVQSFDPGPPPTISAVIATNELVITNQGGDTVDLQTQSLQLPVLSDVPILFPRGGGYNLTFPVQAGDEVLIVFSDTAIDDWMQSGGVNNNQVSQRRHNLSDAIAILGLSSAAKSMSGSYSASDCQLTSDDGSVAVSLSSGQITVAAATVTVNSTTANINASTANVTGTTKVVIDGNNLTTIDGIVFYTHTHPVTSAPGTTGPPG